MLIRIITSKVSVVSIMIVFFVYSILLTLQMILGKCVKCLLTTSTAHNDVMFLV